MKTTKRSLVLLLLGTILCVVPGRVFAQDEGEPEVIRRKTPSGQYIDPASFFRFHGYVTLVYAAAGPDVGSEVGMTPHILLGGASPRTGRNESGFRNDAALFVGGEPFDGVSTVVEVHFVGNALNPVLTEAKITWDVLGEEAPWRARLSGGRFWWPFGIHNDEWFSAINRFNVLSPAAGEVVPAHYNEVGLMLEGEGYLNARTGVNYALSAGNGVPSFELMDAVVHTPHDYDANRTVTGRAGFVWMGAGSVEVGLNGAAGGLRTGTAPGRDLLDPHRYAADFSAFGPDLRVDWSPVTLRAYYYVSRESLSDARETVLDRNGFTVEPGVTFAVPGDRVESITLLGRYGYAEEDRLEGGVFARSQVGAALNLQVTSNLTLKFSYVAQQEASDTPSADNDVFSFSLTSEF